jgi:dihydropteroate synthase
MGVLNVTPDSFSDGGSFLAPPDALQRARDMLDQGADLIDIGAESTRPGSEPVAPEEQWRRLAPVIEPVARLGACVSVDTANAWVAEQAIHSGARVVNDVTALADPAMAGLIARTGAGVVLMHMRGNPRTMQADPQYRDVRREVAAFLIERARAAEQAGVPREAIAIDPGIGFGKTPGHNFELLSGIEQLAGHDYPVVVGASRKSFLQSSTGRTVDQRMVAGLAVATLAAFFGARIVRTHDVAETIEVVKVAEKWRRSHPNNPDTGAI